MPNPGSKRDEDEGDQSRARGKRSDGIDAVKSLRESLRACNAVDALCVKQSA